MDSQLQVEEYGSELRCRISILMSASERQIKGGANLPLILLQTHDSLRYALNTINICHLSRFVKKHTSISGAIDGRRNLKLLLEEFDKM